MILLQINTLIVLLVYISLKYKLDRLKNENLVGVFNYMYGFVFSLAQ